MHVAKSGRARRLGGRAPTVNAGRGVSRATGMAGDRAYGVGAGEHDRVGQRLGELEIDALGRQQRSDCDGVAARAQRGSGALRVRLRPVTRSRTAHSTPSLPTPTRGTGSGRESKKAPPARSRSSRPASAPSAAASATAPSRVRSMRSLPSGLAISPRNAVGRPQRGMARNRRAAGAVEHREERALGRERGRGVGVVDRVEQGANARVVVARLDRDGALSDRRQEIVRLQQRRGRIGKTEPLQSGKRQQRGVDLAGVELAQPGLDIAAQETTARSGRSA